MLKWLSFLPEALSLWKEAVNRVRKYQQKQKIKKDTEAIENAFKKKSADDLNAVFNELRDSNDEL